MQELHQVLQGALLAVVVLGLLLLQGVQQAGQPDHLRAVGEGDWKG
jgi:hypothetical protein